MDTLRSLALVDIGGTVLPNGADAELLDAHHNDGVLTTDIRGEVDALIARYASNQVPYEVMVQQLMFTYARGLKGSREVDVQASTDRYFQRADQFGFVEPTLSQLAMTHQVMLVTGAAQFTAQAVANRLNTPARPLVHGFVSTQIGVTHGIVNGEVDSVLATSDDKTRSIRALAEAGAGTLKGSFGLGNEIADLGMLSIVTTPICVNPSTGLAEMAQQNGWDVVSSERELASPACLQVVRLALASSYA